MATEFRAGVLALQGDVVEHIAALERNGVDAREVRSQRDLDAIDALIIPGGESTTVIRLLERFGLAEPIVSRARGGMPLWGTCMGLIVVAHEVAGLEQKTLDLIDVTVRRNAFGRQLESAEQPLHAPVLGEEPFPAIFIRAPWIERAGPGVEILARVGEHGVFVRQGNILGTSFHPELTQDDRVHRYFIAMATQALGQRTGASV